MDLLMTTKISDTLSLAKALHFRPASRTGEGGQYTFQGVFAYFANLVASQKGLYVTLDKMIISWEGRFLYMVFGRK